MVTGKNGITDIDFILEMFGKDRKKATESFETFHKEINNDVCLDIEERRRLTDDEAKEAIKKICNVKNCTQVQCFEHQVKNESLRRLKEEGLSTRQIARLTGISRVIVLKA